MKATCVGGPRDGEEYELKKGVVVLEFPSIPANPAMFEVIPKHRWIKHHRYELIDGKLVYRGIEK